ncbi:LysE family translocator [Paraferrimonas sp. SM1919]|uniref:LysE family translocator n=1 Tax=Paraferrimonas sp. SM1919 TaxID=2662263 RepID=UPI0013D2D94A|nr:LysE family translocator [Paraferrimonas sp. SM1919]
MFDWTLFAVFLPTFFFVSITPGMCMTLAMTLGMSVGVRRTLWMMLGELIGVATVAVASVVGVASFMFDHPQVFTAFKFVGGLYLAYLGTQMWQAKGKMALTNDNVTARISNYELFSQGLITAIANPKGWAFMVALLPPFINPEKPFMVQLSALIGIIMFTEFSCLMLYASTGKSIRLFMNQGNNLALLNRFSGGLMLLLGLWLILG